MPLKSQPVSCQSPSFVLLQRISPFFETVASAHVIESIATPSMANLFFGSSLVPASLVQQMKMPQPWKVIGL